MRGIFSKVFIYTTIFLIVLVCVTVALFSQQFISYYRVSQMQKVSSSYQHLVDQLQGKSESEFPEIARQFY